MSTPNRNGFFNFEKAIEEQIRENQFDKFRDENRFTQRYAARLFRDAGQDDRYLSYCNTRSTPQEQFKFRLLLAKQIHDEDVKVLGEMEEKTRYRTLGQKHN